MFGLRPNPPRMVTLVVAVVLFAVGLIGVLPPLAQSIEPVNDLLATLPYMTDLGLTLDAQLPHLLLIVAPLLLIVASLLPGVCP